MSKKPVLVVMAAGMGSRYGGLKQIDPVGSHGEAILDYSIYDAHRAGFDTVVIIIKKAIEKDFMETVGQRLKKAPVTIRYAYQELEDLPKGFRVPGGRVKPWGTGQAILSARAAIDGAPFAVINADDYYGRSAFRVIFDHLSRTAEDAASDYCMVGYALGKTVTDHGTVSRGVCEIGGNGCLTRITERLKIAKYDGGIHYTEDDGATWTDLPADTVVSMNMWGFTPHFLEQLEACFPAFLAEAMEKNPLKGEYLLPTIVEQLLARGQASVRVLSSADQWYGITYPEDKPLVTEALGAMTCAGTYPDGLWR